MECPNCKSDLIKKNGHTRHGTQNYRCLNCGRQFTQNAEAHFISEQTKELIRRSLLERVFLNGVCRIFYVSMPWLLDFIDTIIRELPDNLHAEVSGAQGS